MVEDEIVFVPYDASVEVIAAAGVAWDALVRAAAAHELWGIENLAGIPGTVGAAPVQNIGAYGAECANTFAWLECYDTVSNTLLRFDAEACGFGYRESRFKREPNLIILRVALRLTRTGTPNTAYPDLQRLAADGEPLDTPQAIGEAVRRVRSRKFPDLSRNGTAGSFFKNPTITTNAYAHLKLRYSELPGFETSAGIKIPLAWILDHVLSLRGFTHGRAWLFENQPLVLVTEFGATAEDVNTLAEIVIEKVFVATGVMIEREVQSLP